MEPESSKSANLSASQQSNSPEASPSKSVTAFKASFFSLIRLEEPGQKIQKFLISNRKILTEKVILHLYIAQPKLYYQFRYLLLALSLTLDRKDEYAARWGTFYEITNQILKMPDHHRLTTKIQSHLINFTIFLIESTVTTFFADFPETLQLIQSSAFKSPTRVDEQNMLLVKRIVRIFNSLLCLKFVSAEEYINLIYYFGLKSTSYVEFLTSIEDKFVKRLTEYEKPDQKQQADYLILDAQKIYLLISIFYDIDPENKLRQLLSTELKQESPKVRNRMKQMNMQLSQLQNKKANKNKSIHYDRLLKFILKQIIKNKHINTNNKKCFIAESFNQIQEIDQQFFDYLLEAQGNQENSEASQVLIKVIQKQSLRFITVSRIISILKRINLTKNMSYSINLKKMFRTLRLLYWLAKKFNQSLPTYRLDLESSIKISNLSKAMMVIFSIDFREPQVGRIIQFEVNKVAYDILIKYSQHQDSCAIEVITQVDGQQKLKQKKQIGKWSYILCMVGLCEKKVISIFIDGACFKLPLNDSAKQIKNIEFGPYCGSIKDVYILDKVYEMHQINKGYFQKCRKMNSLLDELGQKQFIFTFDRGKVVEQSRWFWKKQMSVQYEKVQKIRSISFGEGIEQIGGFPALLFLVTRIITSQKSDELVNFLIDFFQFLKLLINQTDARQAQKWVLNSTVYFGEFLWLVLSKNEYLRSQKIFFNRIFDFFGHFFKVSVSEFTGNLRLAIIGDIYLNFEIWSKCQTQIKMMLFQQILAKVQEKQSIILHEMFNRKDYDKIMSSLVFFFLEENPNNDIESHYISGVKVSLVHDQISKLGSKFCQLYTHEKFQNNSEIVRKDLILTMSLINTFFQKDHLYFSQSQLSILAVLLGHISKNFTNLTVLERTLDYQIFIFDHLTNLISICPCQSELIFLLFEISFIVMTGVENIKNGTALILDNYTLNNKRSQDSLQFSFKTTLIIIKSSRILFEPNPYFSQEQVISVLLGSLRSRANATKQKPETKLSYEDFTKQFQKFSLAKLSFLFSMTEFSMVIKECVRDQDIFPTACFFLKIIVKNSILPDAQPLALNCLKIVSQALRTNTNQKTQIMVNNSGKESQGNLIENSLNNHCILKLTEVLQSTDIDQLFKTCRCPQLIQILINLKCLNPKKARFVLPFSPQEWKNLPIPLGGALASIIKMQICLSSLELQLLLGYLISIKSQNNTQEVGQNQMNKGQGQRDILQTILPMFILHNSLTSAASDPQKLFGSDLHSIALRCFEFIDPKDITKLCAAIKAHKSIIATQIKKEDSQLQVKKMELANLSQRILDEESKFNNTIFPFQNQLLQFKEKLSKPQEIQGNPKYLKKVSQQVKEAMENFQLFVQAFGKKSSTMKSNQKVQSSSSSILRRRKTTDSSKKGKMLQISDPKQRDMYHQDLRNTIKNVCTKLQNQSKRKEQAWKSLYNQNKFWVSSKIKNNECYQIHPKMTGFYRLNIVKTAFDQVPYPRRKSFEHQIESSNSQTTEQEVKLTNNQLIKTLMPFEDPQQNVQRTATQQILQNSVNIKNDAKAPKDSLYAEYITQRGVYAGIIYYSSQDQCFIFRCKGYNYLPKDNIVYQLSTIFHRIDDLQFKIAIQVNQKSQIFARRYIHRHTAIQIYSYQRSYFFNLFFKETRDKFLKSHSSKMTTIPDPKLEFQKRKYTDRWLNGEFDNFEYLMLINLFSGRTFNDLAQYPVMPWVLTNYDEQEAELNKQFLKEQKNIRDLSKPAGKLSQKKFQNLKMRCNEIDFEDYQSKFLYGTMYSNPTVIYNFFIRLEPFTTLHWEHQGRRIDHADRLFSAVRDQFSTVLSSTSDNKELTPQFYYWPQFLKNRNKVNLGIKQNKEEVHDVKLPGWAKNPEQFIFKMREILQSADVTRNIHNWIDLIFGYKNPREKALEYDNLFHYRSYEHDIFETQQSEQAIKGAQISISQFGQIPQPLFLKPHPQRTLVCSDHFKLDKSILIKKQTSKKLLSLQMVSEGLFIAYQNQVEYYLIESPKILDSMLQKPIRSYTSEGSVVKSFDFTNSIWLSLKDGTFRIFDKKQCMTQIDCEMECFSNFGKYIIYGYRSELIVCRVQNSLKLFKISSFYGHRSNIYRIDTSIILDIVVSVDKGGLVLVHEFSKLKLLRQFELGAGIQVADLCIHQMGYFIFLTKNQKLIIYTFLGELYLKQDIGIANKAISEQITKILILEQNRSLLLVSTDKGKIYVIDFLQIKRFNQNCVYKQFSRFKNNILQNCPRLGTPLGIKDFFVKKLPGKNVVTYKFYVLFQNFSISCFYSAQQFQQKIKQNRMLGQLGFFDSSN